MFVDFWKFSFKMENFAKYETNLNSFKKNKVKPKWYDRKKKKKKKEKKNMTLTDESSFHWLLVVQSSL